MYLFKFVNTLLATTVLATGQPLCDKYTTALFKDNTEDNQLKLLTALVNTVVIGNFSATVNNQPVPGILAPATFNGQPVNMLPFFTGQQGATANVNGVATAGVNFLDGGGADPLKQGLPANSQNTRQFKLLTHLYQLFGSLLGCSKQGGQVFPNYAGNPSMTDVHRFMKLDNATMSFFIQQVGAAALSFGVTPDDANVVGNALTALFNDQCTAPAPLTPQSSPQPQAFCLGSGCSPQHGVDPTSCPQGPGSLPNNSPSGASNNQQSQQNSGSQSSGQSLCDKYTTALFKDNTEDNQLKLLTALVNRVVGGNFTATANGKPVTGILVKGTFDGQPVDMLPFFTGQSGPTTNVGGVATAGINFLDGGAADALKQGLPANDPNSRQFKLLTHLYQLFGSLLACSKQGGQVFPNYSGNPSMLDTHRFMNLNKATMDFFIDQVGQAAISFGVTADDATKVGQALQTLFNNQCAPLAKLTPQTAPTEQGFCLGDGCQNLKDQTACPNGVQSNTGSTSSSSGSSSASSNGKVIKCLPRGAISMGSSVHKRSEL
ncbi:hypothetical protein HK103_003538 [Boothiomyces macroporosus]|uniref:Uncharacterized protein n=1 Tax=Boothiomyces macroporosus TaxID=261099 RepID=A0AAD5UK90_9FUNG|nr:hypothetical protein HK103_003538 [Boothiomyces macroporosus]